MAPSGPLADASNHDYFRLSLGVPVRSAVEPGCTQYFALDASPRADGELLVQLDRESGDPVLMASTGDVPSCDPLRDPIVHAHVWDEMAFNASLSVHRVRLQPLPSAKSSRGRVAIGVYNFYGVKREALRFVIRADLVGTSRTATAAERGVQHQAPRRVRARSSSPLPGSKRASSREVPASRSSLARADASTLQDATAIERAVARALRRKDGVNEAGTLEWYGSDRPEVLLRGLLHQHHRLKKRFLSRALLNVIHALLQLLMRDAMHRWQSQVAVDIEPSAPRGSTWSLPSLDALERLLHHAIARVHSRAFDQWKMTTVTLATRNEGRPRRSLSPVEDEAVRLPAETEGHDTSVVLARCFSHWRWGLRLGALETRQQGRLARATLERLLESSGSWVLQRAMDTWTSAMAELRSRRGAEDAVSKLRATIAHLHATAARHEAQAVSLRHERDRLRDGIFRQNTWVKDQSAQLAREASSLVSYAWGPGGGPPSSPPPTQRRSSVLSDIRTPYNPTRPPQESAPETPGPARFMT